MAPDRPDPPDLDAGVCAGQSVSGFGGHGPLVTTWLEALLAADCLRGLVVYGSPYAFEVLRDRIPATIPCGFSYGQMPLAQRLLLNQLGFSLEATAQSFTD